MFGELAIVRLLEKEGWEAVWVDTFHRKFWRHMPDGGAPVQLPPVARLKHDAIVRANGGKASGFFDVMAWRQGQFLFVEYKGPRDSANRNEARWIAAALRSGVAEGDLLLVRS